MRLVVLFSGGRDSTCLLHRHAGAVVCALHVNYGLRGAESDADEAHCRAVCARLGVSLVVHRAGAPEGNVQAWARAVRYAAAERLAEEHDALIAVGHTATDQAETVLYRLISSPGRRALLGMPERSGRVVRPLLGMTREETAAYCRAHGLSWREDASNATSARGALRSALALHPAAEHNVLATLATLRDEAAVLDDLVDAVLRAGGAPADPRQTTVGWRTPQERGGQVPAGGRVEGAAGGREGAAGVDLSALPPALARLVLQRLADEAGGPSIAAHTDAILALQRTGTATLDLPGGLRAISEYGRIRIDHGPPTSPAPTRLPVPGRVKYGAGELTCERGAFALEDGTLAAHALAPTLEVRAWRPGDRMRPLGLHGTKSLQDLFTDRKVPRERRAQIPVVVSDGEIAWVPGVATGEPFRAQDTTEPRVRLSWRLDSAAP